MCGIVGTFGGNTELIQQACEAIKHRGPDDSGIWHTKNVYSIGLVHRRLSISPLRPY